jgi:hypothetical protein
MLCQTNIASFPFSNSYTNASKGSNTRQDHTTIRIWAHRRHQVSQPSMERESQRSRFPCMHRALAGRHMHREWALS